MESDCDVGITCLHGVILWRITQWRHVTLTSQRDMCAEMEFWVALLLYRMIELSLVGKEAEARLPRKNILVTRAD